LDSSRHSALDIFGHLALDISGPIAVSDGRVESKSSSTISEDSASATSAYVVFLAVRLVFHENASGSAGRNSGAGATAGATTGTTASAAASTTTGSHLSVDPADELRYFSEDPGFAVAFSGAEGNDADDGAAASEGATGIAHASRPSSWLSKNNSSWRLVSAPFGLCFGLGPNLTSDLLELIGQGLRVSSDKTPS